MLEQEITSLKLEIVQLKDAINTLSATLIGVAHALPTIPSAPNYTPEPKPKPMPEPMPEPTPEPEPTPKPTPDPVTVDELQTLCTTLVRKNAELRETIRATIASFDGAKTLKKVPADKLPELKAALEALA